MRPSRGRTASLVVLLAVSLSACGPTDTTVVWEQRVPSPAPAAVENQQVIARGAGTITLLPISPRGAVIGVAYGYDMPHCGIKSPIDVDGSFWDAVDVPADTVEFDGVTGTFRLISPTAAVFTT